MDRTQYLSRRLSAESVANDADLRAVRFLRPGCGKPAAALRQDAGALARALRGECGARRANVRSCVCSRMAPVSCRVGCRLQVRRHAVIPGELQPRSEEHTS